MRKPIPPKEPPALERLIDAVEAATYLGVSRPCIDKWVRARFIPCVHIGRLLRFRPETLRDWVKAQETAPTPPLTRDDKKKR